MGLAETQQQPFIGTLTATPANPWPESGEHLARKSIPESIYGGTGEPILVFAVVQSKIYS